MGKDQTINPTEYIEEIHDSIEEIEAMSEMVLGRLLDKPVDRVTIYALFYIHILKTETLEERLIRQFDTLLRNCDLDGKFNLIEILSVFGAIPKLKKKEAPSSLTHAEAIRNCLAHKLFGLTFHSDSWSITFDNKGTYGSGRFGYQYKRQFSGAEFVEYFTLTEFLYKSALVLIYLTILAQLLRRIFSISG